MAKRFTDSEKWNKTWFSELSKEAKLTWIYLTDRCDHRGVWPKNYRLMSFQLGFKVTEENLANWFGDRLHELDSDKIFIPSFIDFQYRTLRAENRAHTAILELLDRLKQAPSKPLRSPCQGDKVMVTVTVTDTVTDKEKEKEETSPLLGFDFESVYREHYPKKVTKSEGLELCRQQIKTSEDFAAWQLAMKNYAAEMRRVPRPGEFIPSPRDFVRFMKREYWRDWVDGVVCNASGETFLDYMKRKGERDERESAIS